MTEQTVYDLVIKAVPHAELLRIDLHESEMGSVAYAIVEFEDLSMMKDARRALRKEWIGSKLIKVKTLADKEAESHAERTLVLKNIPKNMMAQELLENFKEFGSIINYELPVQDQMIREGLDQLNKSDFGRLKQAEREVEIKITQKLEKDSIYQEYLDQ